MLDILFVTFNSIKWLDNCIESILFSDYDLKTVTLNLVDNHSSDGTWDRIQLIKKRYESTFNAIHISSTDQNKGFGVGNNLAASLGSGDIILCLNIDTTVYVDTFCELMKEINSSDEDIGIWELRQFPYEHPKFYDPLSCETSWCSGACFAIRRDIFEMLGGFDENIFLYAEDVDLSWRVRAAGYKLKYVPRAVINHYSYDSIGQIKPDQYVFSKISNLYLRYKFGTPKQVSAWYRMIIHTLHQKEPFSGSRARLLKAFISEFPYMYSAKKWNREHKKVLREHQFSFIGWDYSINRSGAFFENQRPNTGSCVSVIVRTCGRPNVLREALVSLRNQTYQNFEVVVVEDGPNLSEAFIRNEFSDLRLVYSATGKKVGRCQAGNIALAKASGTYINFLDDDDLFYPDHLETLIRAFQDHPEERIVYSLAFETPISILCDDPYIYEVSGYNRRIVEQFSRLKLSRHNQFPIQAVMFARELYDELGGFDESLEVLEDWDMWVRYSSKYRFFMIGKTTSIYRIPADDSERDIRQSKLDSALSFVQKKQEKIPVRCTYADLRAEYDAVLKELQQHNSQPAPAWKRTLVYKIARKLYHFIINP